MITAAPLPAWGDLLALLKPSVPGDDLLAAPWAGGAERAYGLSRSAWSMAALVETRKIEGEARPRLWLPDFFCNQSSGPARAAGAEIIFYPVTAALTPDWAACKALAERARPSLFVLVHYFGASNDVAGARAFCAGLGAALVEDAAHVLKPAAGIGSTGDFVLYSPHKLIGIPDGAILVAREPSGALDRALAALSAAAPSPWAWTAKRIVQQAIPEIIWKALRPIPDLPFDQDPPSGLLPESPMMSRTARKMLACAVTHLEAETTRRRAAENALRTKLGEIPDWAPWPARWAEGEAPYRAVFVCDTPAVAVERFALLRRAGCLVESWPDLASEVTADPLAHRTAIDLRRRLLTFPLPREDQARAFARDCSDALRP